MATLVKPSQAGTVESTDILITLTPAEQGTGITVEIVSPTLQQYGRQIRKVILDTLAAHDVQDAHVHANDKGAWDCTIEARMTTAITRALS